MNQLLNKDLQKHIVDFDTLQPEDFAKALDYLMPKVKEEHDYSINQAKLTYEDFIDNVENTRQYSAVLYLLYSLHSVNKIEGIRKVFEEYIPKTIELGNELSLDERYYFKLKEYVKTEDFNNLNDLLKKSMELSIFNYELDGINLPKDKKDKLKELNIKLSELTTKFENNLVDTHAKLSLEFEKEELEGLPARAFDNLTIKENGKYEATYTSGSFDDISMFADNESSRKKVYDAQLYVGSMEELDNRPLVKEIVKIKQEMAQIRGFENYAKYALVQKMVKDPKHALSFVQDLSTKSFPQAQEEINELEFFGKNLLNRKPEFWDRSYINQKFKTSLYSLNPEETRAYFPVKKVISGLFNIVENLYGIKFVENKDRSVWHEDVTVFNLMSEGKVIGTLFLDLYKRENKSDGAWMMGVVGRGKDFKTQEVSIPVAHIVCDATKNLKNETTFTFYDLITLFHEMGHALHHLLTTIDEECFSGLSNVEQDAVELPSQFMENFCWDYEVLKEISSHVDTGEVLPYELYEKLLASKNYLAASAMVRQASFSEIDMKIYSEKERDPFEIENEVFEKWKTREIDHRSSFITTFSHIMSGGYGAGYYAYKWAEVLSADAFAALKEAGSSYIEQKEVAQKFREVILERGGSKPMLENFKEFRGREPSVDFLLADNGIKLEIINTKKVNL